MASGDREKPQCRVCKTVFTFKGPEPLLLPCLHPACKSCVDSGDDKITCTTCQELFSKVGYAFPKDFILSKDLFKSALKNCPSEIVCTNRSDGAKAETWCPKCDALLCITCQEFHKESKATRGHVVESIQSYLNPETDVTKTYTQCETHQEYPLEVFDFSCKCLICYKCLHVDHSTCSVEHIDKAFEIMEESELDNNIKQIVARLGDITEREREAQDLTTELEENSEQVRDDIINTFSDIRATLDMREKMILQEANQSFQVAKNKNRERIEDLKQKKIRFEEALRFMKRSKEISDPVQALMMRKTLDERTKICTEADLMMIDGRESSICLSKQDLRDVKRTIETFASLLTVSDQETFEKTVSGPTTQDKQNKKLKEREKKRKAYRQTLEDIPSLIEQRHNKGKIDLKIDGISGIKLEDIFYSKAKHVFNMPWYLSAECTEKDGELMLGLCLCPDTKNAEIIENEKKWKCEVKFNFEITSCFQKGSSKMEELKHEFTDKDNSGYVFSNFVSIKELQDPLKGFAKDDCVHVSVNVELLKRTGLLGLGELLKKKCSETLATGL